jgi:hypothetical protein
MQHCLLRHLLNVCLVLAEVSSDQLEIGCQMPTTATVTATVTATAFKKKLPQYRFQHCNARLWQKNPKNVTH